MITARTFPAAVLMLLTGAGLAGAQQTPATAPPSAATASHGHQTAAPAAEAAQWFTRLKALDGSWQGPVSTEDSVPEMQGVVASVTMRATSMGNAIMHNMRFPERRDDPVTMLYLENDRLLLTHYCDAGNRPRMEAKLSPDGKTVVFEFIDLVGPTKYGHMNRAAFTFVDADHHIQEWTYILPNNTPVRVRMDLRRVKQPAT